MAYNISLKLAILESGLKQTVIAARARMHESRLSQIISGRRPANDDEQKAIAKALRRPRHELFPEAIAS